MPEEEINNKAYRDIVLTAFVLLKKNYLGLP